MDAVVLVRWLAAAVLLSLPPVGVVLLANRAVDHLGAKLGEGAAAWARELPAKPAVEPVPPAETAPDSAVGPQTLVAAKASAAGRRGPRGVRKGAASRVAKVRGVYVPSTAVLRLAQASAMPRAVPVGVSGPRPAGLRLVGVSALGIGMQEGDVLTQVMGAPVSSVADVVGRVLAARSRRTPKISGEFWRGGEVWNLVVEQPYLESSPLPSAP